MYMSDKWRNETKDSEMLQILKTKKREIAMKKRKSYGELEPVKKKNSVWRGFVTITIILKTKRNTAKTYIPVSHAFKKKWRKGQITYVLSGVWSVTTLIGKTCWISFSSWTTEYEYMKPSTNHYPSTKATRAPLP